MQSIVNFCHKVDLCVASVALSLKAQIQFKSWVKKYHCVLCDKPKIIYALSEQVN